MLRVGLTGDLGSGKSTVAAMLQQCGAVLFSSDEMARALMQPGQPAFDVIVERFGREVLTPTGELNRRRLATLAFQSGRAAELEDIIHPAVIAEQARLLNELARSQPGAIAVVESALIFITQHGTDGQPWRTRFDYILLVVAPLEQKLERFLARAGGGRVLGAEERAQLEADARARLALQSHVNEAHRAECLVIDNSRDRAGLERQVAAAWLTLREAAASTL